ncbi:non-homologous end-joining DNA ligase [Streptomyces virens]|uniref:Bifunctional non-homologous end joining protein LigD n=3 Tax=Streptomyces TaxID=1883 RepID=A0AA40S954_9ACTN|nr:non-homologous end-joining DNA ligase [Streptomyces calvus]MBA8942127.1 bifunctional non-homologous end joining protein LigD [Streptomyces calvus]MBA8975944.1 bifunctional non-homologous end joining protein LigD [Streptomyces calvus]GGP52573.1 ATP-dependent DNA ligase [Streptomyces calvus]
MSDGGARTVRAGRRSVQIHRPDKVLFPGGADAAAYTKGDLVDYHRAVAPYMLPHLRGRPLMLDRRPDGVDGPAFMQKNTPDAYPDWITRAEVAKEGGTVTHTVCDDTATLLHLVDQASITLHRWLSRTRRIDRPDRLVFDLDPQGDDFEAVREAARLLGGLLDELRLPSAPMTTGSRGLHIVVPLSGEHDFDDVRAFARDVAETLAAAHPDRLTTAARKKDRGDRLYLDVQRNAYAQTAVAPYTVRALPGAPVATPFPWDRLDDPDLHARRWTVADAVEQARSDPWAALPRRGRALGPARRRLAALRG